MKQWLQFDWINNWKENREYKKNACCNVNLRDGSTSSPWFQLSFTDVLLSVNKSQHMVDCNARKQYSHPLPRSQRCSPQREFIISSNQINELQMDCTLLDSWLDVNMWATACVNETSLQTPATWFRSVQHFAKQYQLIKANLCKPNSVLVHVERCNVLCIHVASMDPLAPFNLMSGRPHHGERSLLDECEIT